jgi:hypothetical protein
MGQPNDEPHVHLCARALHQLGRVGFRCEDDRIARGLVWLDRAFDGDRGASSIETVSAIARCAGRLLPATHRLHQSSEQRLRSGQREDGSFGTVVQTASALRGLLALGPACVQVDRAARFLIDTVLRGRLQQTTVVLDGVGLSPFASDPSAGVREVYTALKDLAARTSSRA